MMNLATTKKKTQNTTITKFQTNPQNREKKALENRQRNTLIKAKLNYSKTCLKRPLKKKTKISF